MRGGDDERWAEEREARRAEERRRIEGFVVEALGRLQTLGDGHLWEQVAVELRALAIIGYHLGYNAVEHGLDDDCECRDCLLGARILNRNTIRRLKAEIAELREHTGED